MKNVTPVGKVFIYLISAFAGLLLLLLWGDILGGEAFGRAVITLVIVMVALALVTVVKRDMGGGKGA